MGCRVVYTQWSRKSAPLVGHWRRLGELGRGHVNPACPGEVERFLRCGTAVFSWVVSFPHCFERVLDFLIWILIHCGDGLRPVPALCFASLWYQSF